MGALHSPATDPVDEESPLLSRQPNVPKWQAPPGFIWIEIGQSSVGRGLDER